MSKKVSFHQNRFHFEKKKNKIFCYLIFSFHFRIHWAQFIENINFLLCQQILYSLSVLMILVPKMIYKEIVL